MRTLTTDQQAVYEATGGSFATHFRAFLSNDNGATWYALRELADRDWLLGMTWEVTIDQGVTEARLIVVREQHGLSLAPDMTTSMLNLPGGVYSPLLKKGVSQLRLEVATVPIGAAPAAGNWVNVWEGVLVGVADAGEGMLELYCRDNLWLLVRTFIERERAYGDSTAGEDVEKVLRRLASDNYLAPGYKRWKPSTAFTAGDMVIPTAGKATGYWYVCTASGTSGSTEPTWPTSALLFNDGTTQWLLDTPLSAKEYLVYTPTTPGWELGSYSQQMESTFTAMEGLTLQLGWHLRMRYDEATNQWRITFYQPDRDKVVPDYTLTTYQRRAVPSWGGVVDDIRNRVRVGYYDKDDLDAAGNPKLKEVIVEDTTSQATYGGVYFMNFTPGASANIDTATEATTLANSALSDLSQPPVDAEVDCPFLHFVELGDLIRVPPDGVHHDVETDMAVTRLSHKITDKKATTTLSLRGKPMVARDQWLLRQAQRGNAITRPENGPEAVTGLTVQPTTSGVAVSFVPPLWGRGAEEYELHLSTSSGFTPDDTTFYAKGKQTTFNVTDLDPGQTYYTKVVPREAGILTKPGIRGTASSEESFMARYVEPRTLQPRVTYAALPLNSDFEAYNNPIVPPDAWEMASGTWGADAEVDTTITASGGNAVRFNATAVQTSIRSAAFVCAQTDLVRASAEIAVEGILDLNEATLSVRWLDKDFAEVGTTLIATAASTGTSAFTTTGSGAVVAAPVGTRYAQLEITKSTTDAYQVWLDSTRVDVEPAGPVTSSGFSFQNSFADATPSGSAGYLIDVSGYVNFEGAVAVSPTPSTGTVMAILPAGFRPLQNQTFPVVSDGGTFGSIRVETDGDVVFVSGTTTTRLWIDGVRFRADLS